MLGECLCYLLQILLVAQYPSLSVYVCLPKCTVNSGKALKRIVTELETVVRQTET